MDPGVGLDDSFGSLSTQNTIQFYDSSFPSSKPDMLILNFTGHPQRKEKQYFVELKYASGLINTSSPCFSIFLLFKAEFNIQSLLPDRLRERGES